MNSRHAGSLIIATLHRYHTVIFTVAITLTLAVAVFLLNGVVQKTSGSGSAGQNTTKASFDQATIDRIKDLKSSNESSEPLDFSRGRISPFSE